MEKTKQKQKKLTLDLKLRLVKLQLPLLVAQLFSQVFILKAEFYHRRQFSVWLKSSSSGAYTWLAVLSSIYDSFKSFHQGSGLNKSTKHILTHFCKLTGRVKVDSFDYSVFKRGQRRDVECCWVEENSLWVGLPRLGQSPLVWTGHWARPVRPEGILQETKLLVSKHNQENQQQNPLNMQPVFSKSDNRIS